MTGQVKGMGGNTYVLPLGYVWKSASSICPAELYDGTTWAQIKDQAIIASGDAYTLGDSGGDTTAALATAEMPSHTHSGSTSSAGAHTHTVSSGYTSTGGGATYGDYIPYSGSSATSSAGNHAHAVTVGSTGNGKAFNIMMPYIVRYMWERVG